LNLIINVYTEVFKNRKWLSQVMFEGGSSGEDALQIRPIGSDYSTRKTKTNVAG